jgi:hypothetical protein
VLERQAGRPAGEASPWKAHAGALTAIAVGVIGLVVAALIQFGGLGGKHEITEPPTPWATLPFLIGAAIATAVAFVRREPRRALAFVGLGAAGAGVAIGWVLIAAAVGAGAVLACLIIAKFT